MSIVSAAVGAGVRTAPGVEDSIDDRRSLGRPHAKPIREGKKSQKSKALVKSPSAHFGLRVESSILNAKLEEGNRPFAVGVGAGVRTAPGVVDLVDIQLLGRPHVKLERKEKQSRASGALVKSSSVNSGLQIRSSISHAKLEEVRSPPALSKVMLGRSTSGEGSALNQFEIQSLKSQCELLRMQNRKLQGLIDGLGGEEALLNVATRIEVLQQQLNELRQKDLQWNLVVIQKNAENVQLRAKIKVLQEQPKKVEG